jgi:hypothetical protein
MPHKDPQKRKEYQRQYYLKNRERKIAQVCANQKKNRAKRNEYQRKYHQRIRLEVIRHYGGKCACCGETEEAFLQMDHIDGNGNEHRRQIEKEKGGRVPMTYWLRQNGFPGGFQVLCANCNMAKWRLGKCPHELAEAAEMTVRHPIGWFPSNSLMAVTGLSPRTAS